MGGACPDHSRAQYLLTLLLTDSSEIAVGSFEIPDVSHPNSVGARVEGTANPTGEALSEQPLLPLQGSPVTRRQLR